MPKVCKQLVPAAQKKNKITRYIINITYSYLATVAESLMEMEGCDTCKENVMYNDYCHQSAPQNDST